MNRYGDDYAPKAKSPFGVAGRGGSAAKVRVAVRRSGAKY